MNKREPLSYQELERAVEYIQDFMEMEGLEFWETSIRGDAYEARRWVSKDVLRRFLEEI